MLFLTSQFALIKNGVWYICKIVVFWKEFKNKITFFCGDYISNHVPLVLYLFCSPYL